MTLREQILSYKKEHPNEGFKKVAHAVGCTKNAVKYHLSPGAKERNVARVMVYRRQNPLWKKVQNFRQLHEKKKNFDRVEPSRRVRASSQFTTTALISKIMASKVCYLTGEAIDIDDLNSFEFDHKVPVSKGGSNDLDNFGLCIRAVNRAKNDMTPEEFLQLCLKVVKHHGYTITKEGV